MALLQMNFLPILTWLSRRGDVVRIPGRNWWLLNDPQAARAVLALDGTGVKKGEGHEAFAPLTGESVFLAEGADWQTKRAAVHGAFRKDELEAHAGATLAHTERMLERWPSSASVDAYGEMRRLLVGLFGETILGTTALTESAAQRAIMEDAWDEAVRRGFSLTAPLPSRKGARAIAGLRALADAAAGAPASAMLRHIASAKGADGCPVYSRKALTDEALTLALGGHECTALAIGWTLALLGTDERALARVLDEIDGLNGREPAPADAARMARTRAAFNEAMRLYPPAWILSRTGIESVAVDGHAPIPAGDNIIFLPFLMHRDARWWGDDALAFRPERFEGQGLEAKARTAFMPFGAGPRACVGAGFATMLALLVIPRILQRYVPRTTKLPSLAPGLTLHPRGPLTVTFTARSSS